MCMKVLWITMLGCFRINDMTFEEPGCDFQCIYDHQGFFSRLRSQNICIKNEKDWKEKNGHGQPYQDANPYLCHPLLAAILICHCTKVAAKYGCHSSFECLICFCSSSSRIWFAKYGSVHTQFSFESRVTLKILAIIYSCLFNSTLTAFFHDYD